MTRRFGVAALLAVVGLVAASCSSDGQSSTTTSTTSTTVAPTTTTNAPTGPAATLSGPIAGTPATTTNLDLAAVGYVEEEWLVAGTASSYTSAAPLSADGEWSVTPAEQAEYRTRMIVRRPIDPKEASGTVVVEWLNVTAGMDAAPNFTYLQRQLLREHDTWVGVSAQDTGINRLRANDAARYGKLVSPGDSFSYDIFSQAGRALRADGAAPMGGAPVRELIAAGQSQSAMRLTTYVDGVHPLARVYDGFLVHSRFAGAASLSQAPLVAINVPSPLLIRTDLEEPVLVFQTEGDVGAQARSLPARQPDSETVITWEVAGTSHADAYLLEAMGIPSNALGCTTPVNTGQRSEVLQAGFHHLVEWIAGGDPPPSGDPLDATPGNPPTMVLDELGIARGGIRTPAVDAPISVVTGNRGTGPSFCVFFGTAVPFDEATLRRLYPTHDDYVAAVRRSAGAGVEAGFLLRPDADELIAVAEASPISR